MTINKTIFLKFLDLIKLKNKIESNEVLLKLKDNTVTAIAKTFNNVLALKGLLKCEIKEEEMYAIDNLKLFKSFVSSFDSELIDIKKKLNKFCVRPGLTKTVRPGLQQNYVE